MTDSAPLNLVMPDAGARHAGELLRRAREAQGLNSEYFRARATTLAPKIVEEEVAQTASPTAPDGAGEKSSGKAQ